LRTAVLEREIKFRVPEERDAAAVCDAIERAGFRLESSGLVTHEDRYLDTDDWILYRAGIALRLRREGERLTLQAKTIQSQTEEVLTRTEWAQDAPPTDPPWESLPDGPVAILLRPLAKLHVLSRLTTRARVESERKMFRWLHEHELLGSVTLDRVREAGTQNGGASYRELEVEALDGAAAALEEVRAAVERRLDLHTSVESKLAAALAAAGEKLPEIPERAYALYEGDRLVDVAAKTLGRHLTRMFWNEAGTRLNLDPEYVHDMRVATRRLRTALQVFAMALPEETRESLGRDLRWIGRALGGVRDLDVGLRRVAAMVSRAPEHERAALYVFARYLEIERARRRVRLLRRLDSKRYEAFRERAQRWLDGGPSLWVPTAAPEAATAPGGVHPALAPAYMVGPRIVAEWDNRMREACQEAERKSTPANVHALRIAVKHARYAVEYFAVSEGQSAHHRAKQLARLQDKLGEHQDAATLLRHMRRYARTIPRRDRQLLLGARGVMDRLEPETRITRGELHELWELGAGADVT
jgi:CHAD domain-containing protein